MSLFSHPVKKLTLLTVFGIGYTLGARAGRERYQQIVDAANQVKSDPRVQDAAAKAQDLVSETATKVANDPHVKDVVSRAEAIVGDAADKVKDDNLVDKAKGAAKDAKDKAKDVASDVKDKAEDVASDDSLVDKAKDVAGEVKEKVADAASDDTLVDKAKGKAKEVAGDAKDKAKGVADDAKAKADDTVNPLLADEHVGSPDEVVFSSGQDIEESIDELAPTDDKDRI